MISRFKLYLAYRVVIDKTTKSKTIIIVAFAFKVVESESNRCDVILYTET